MKTVVSQLSFSSKRKLAIILQDEVAECGLACVAMISNYLGHQVDLCSLRQLEKTSIEGTTLLNIVNLFEKLNIRTRALRVELDELNKVRGPAILHWNMNHFVVFKEIRNRKIIIYDPAIGIRKCSLQEISECFTGVVLALERGENFESVQLKNKLTLFDLVKNIRGIKQSIINLALLSTVIEFLGLMSPLFMQYVTDSAIDAGDLHNLVVLAVGFFLLLLMQVFSEYVRSHSVVYITNNINEQFSANVISHILKLPLHYFEKRHKGDIQSRFQSIEQIMRKISTDFVNALLDGLMILITVLVMFVYSPLLTLVVVATLALFVAVRYASYHIIKRETEASLSIHAKSASVFLETLQAMLPIKTFAKEKVRFNFWQNSYINALNVDIKISRINIFYTTLNKLLFNLEHILVICLGASLILQNKFSVGMLVAYLSYRLQLVNKSTSFIQNLFDYKLISVHLNRLSDILFQEPEKVENGKLDLSSVNGTIEIKDLAFKYDYDKRTVFNHLNIAVSSGEKLVITGPSGCGKTTLLKIMMGLLQSTEGELLIDGIPITQFGVGSYRKITASVMQDDVLMSGSILQNIVFFDDAIDMDLVYQSAHFANVHETIMQLPMGYETLVGDLGSTLSGGQKQRILLARALYKQPKILFLDEATSHLDVNTEIKINQALKSLSITQVVVAHREETIKMADRVIQLNDANQIKE